MSLKPNRIGMLSWDYASPKGGMGVSVQLIARQLLQGGMDVHELSPSPLKGSPFLPFTRSYGGHLLFSLLLPFTLNRALRRMHAGMLLMPVGPGGVFLLRRPVVPYAALVYHTYLQQQRSVPRQRWKCIFIPFERRTLRTAAQIVCFCADTQRVLEREYGLTNVVLLPHAVDMPAVVPQKKRMHVVCVARLEARKGVDVLLAAWPLVLKHVPQALLTIVGRGADEKKTDKATEELSGVSRKQNLPRSELDSVIAQAAVAVCPAYLEGFGLAAAEAMSAGTAVVASDVDGLHSLIRHEKTGLLFQAGDEEALAHAIIRLLTDDALRERIAGAARDYIRLHHNSELSSRAMIDAVSSLE